MKHSSLVLVLFLACMIVGCSGSTDKAETPAGDAEDVAQAPAETPEQPAGETADVSEEDRLHRADPAGAYGEALTLTEPVSIAAIHEDPESFEGRMVCVEGTVTEVCPMRGCWVDLADAEGGSTIRVKVDDGVIVFPLSAKGRSARVEGTVQKIEMTEEEARSWFSHEAAELGQTFDPESVTGPQIIWRIKGQGAEIQG